MKKIYLETLFKKKDCYGWAYHTKGRHYWWQNDNDLGLLGQDWEALKEMGVKETLLRKVKVSDGKYLYILRNTCGVPDDKSCVTLPTLKALLKECHCEQLNTHDKMLVERFWKKVDEDLQENYPENNF